MALNAVQQVLSRYTSFDRAESRVYGSILSSTLPVEASYQVGNNLNNIQIAMDFYSDKSVWSHFGPKLVLGDVDVSNLGTDKDITTYSKTKRYENVAPIHFIRCSADATYSNGFYPNIIYIGNHTINQEDIIEFRAFETNDWINTPAYVQRIPYSPDDIFFVNPRPYSKFKFYEIRIYRNGVVDGVGAGSVPLRIGRMILAGSLPATPENNAQKGVQMGYTDHRDEMMTESKSRLFNRQFWAKKLNFSIQISLSQQKLASQLETLIQEGTGSRPFLVVLNPKQSNYQSIYGVLTQESSFEHKALKYGLYTFDIEEIT